MKQNQDKPQKRRYEQAAMALLAAMMMAMSALTAQAQTTYNLFVDAEYWDESSNSYLLGTDGGGVTWTHFGAVAPGTEVTLTAMPKPGWYFAGWNIDPLIIIHGGSTATFTMPSYHVMIYALFDNRYTVRGVASPTEGGQVKLSLDNSSWSSGTLYVREGQKVYYSISPANGYDLKGGSISIGTDGDGLVSISGNSFTMPADNVTVSALFKENPYSIATTPRSITVSTYLEGTGYGTMVGSASASRSSSSPGYIVTLTATPAPGFIFKEWRVLSGGIDIANPSHATTTFWMNDEDVVVDAVFEIGIPSSLMEDNPFAYPNFHIGEYATLTRTFTNGMPATVCLPFDFATTQASGTFYTFAGVVKDMDGEWEVTMKNTNRVSTSSDLHLLNAGQPYLFVPSKDGGVTFSGTVSSLVAKNSAIGSWTFQGTYYQRRWDANYNTSEIGSVYGFATGQGYEGTPASYGAGTFIRLKTGGIKGFRAFMRYNGPAAARGTTRGDGDEPLPERMRLRLIDADGQTTAIGSINLTTGEASLYDGDGPWHTLQGARLATRPTAKGVYIHSGRKVIIR